MNVRPHVFTPDSTVTLKGGHRMASELHDDHVVMVPGGQYRRLGLVATHDKIGEQPMYQLTLDGGMSVIVPPHVTVLNRLREELYTNAELEWVHPEALRPGDTLGPGDLIGTCADVTRYVGCDHAYEAAHHVTWVRLVSIVKVVRSAPLVVAAIDEIVVNGVCLRRETS